jgi:nicotinamidase-related amidase
MMGKTKGFAAPDRRQTNVLPCSIAHGAIVASDRFAREGIHYMTTPDTPRFVGDWLETIQPVSLTEVVPNPESAAIYSADMINGFLHFGALASPRVQALADDVANLFTLGWSHGIRNVVLLQDTHHPNTPEFDSYPPHAHAGSPESQTIPELASLPFADAFVIIEKNSLNPAIGTAFDGWLDMHREVTTAIVVGNCTDLCIYQLAMHLRMRANALNIHGYEVIVPVNAVDTFDIRENPDAPAGSAHPADFFHEVFLYHMAQNGIRIVSTIT